MDSWLNYVNHFHCCTLEGRGGGRHICTYDVNFSFLLLYRNKAKLLITVPTPQLSIVPVVINELQNIAQWYTRYINTKVIYTRFVQLPHCLKGANFLTVTAQFFCAIRGKVTRK